MEKSELETLQTKLNCLEAAVRELASTFGVSGVSALQAIEAMVQIGKENDREEEPGDDQDKLEVKLEGDDKEAGDDQDKIEVQQEDEPACTLVESETMS